MNCPNCGHIVQKEHRFCGACGTPMQPTMSTRDAESLFVDAVPVKRARLRVVRGTSQGSVFELSESQAVIGREEGDIRFPEDTMVSPNHARFYYRDGRLFVSDEGSLNGTFVRIKQPVPLADGEVFLCGEQVLRFALEYALARHSDISASRALLVLPEDALFAPEKACFRAQPTWALALLESPRT